MGKCNSRTCTEPGLIQLIVLCWRKTGGSNEIQYDDLCANVTKRQRFNCFSKIAAVLVSLHLFTLEVPPLAVLFSHRI